MPQHVNVEIKARSDDPDAVEARLCARGARYVGLDRQVDTYFSCEEGRLKLREGTIENALIHYRRADTEGPRRSDIALARVPPGTDLGSVLAAALGVQVVVAKSRAIYFVDNVKVHVDRVEGLGAFVEIEAIDEDGRIGEARLLAQCIELMEVLGVSEADLVARSYSDLVAERGAGR